MAQGPARMGNPNLKAHYANNFARVDKNKAKRIQQHCTKFPKWAEGMGYIYSDQLNKWIKS